MKFVCTQENLSRGLALVSRVSSKNIALPILNNVLIEATNGSITLRTTNLELGMSVTVRGKVEQDGKFTVQSRVINDFVNNLGDENITVELKGDDLHLTSGHTTSTIKGLPADDFPVMPSSPATRTAQVPSNQLHHCFEGVVFAAANDESRPEISGVLVTLTEKDLVATATDSYRLAERRCQTLASDGEAKIIIPVRTIHEVLRALPNNEEEIHIAIGETQALLKSGETEIVTRLIDGKYPEYQQIIPATWRTKITCGNEALTTNTRAASLFCKPGINDIAIALEPPKTLKLSAANSTVGQHEATVESTIEGDGNNIVFNYRYLLDGLASLPAGDITIELTDSQAPGVIRSKEHPHELYLLMPIRQ